MADAPPVEVLIDEVLVRALLESQAGSDTSSLPIAHAADGWDCSVWRLGDHLAARLPRRAVAAPLTRNEHRWLPVLAERIASAVDIAVPAPVHFGSPEPDLGYPWQWSIVPWIDGRPGFEVARPDRAGWAQPLARSLRALHQPAPADAPENPYRGRPLAVRDAVMRDRLRLLADREGEASAARLREAWLVALDAAPWSGPPLWIHGDLHPGNLIADDGRLAGIIDFGDMTAGDPAYDLSIAWLGFEETGRAAFVAQLDDLYEAPTWTRARGWAAAITATLLVHNDDNPPYLALGRECLAALG